MTTTAPTVTRRTPTAPASPRLDGGAVRLSVAMSATLLGLGMVLQWHGYTPGQAAEMIGAARARLVGRELERMVPLD